MDRNTIYALQLNILSSFLRRPERLGALSAQLRPEDFCEGPECRAVYGAMADLAREGAPVSLVSLRTKLGPALGGFIAQNLDCPVSDSALEWSVKTLKEAARLQAVRAESFHMSTCASAQEAGESLERINSLMTQHSGVECLSLKDAVMRFYDRQNEKAPAYLKWGFPALDRHLFIQPGDFVVLGGYPSAGKTLLSLQFALEQSRSDSVGYFSLETGVDKLTDRIIAHLGQVELSAIKNRALDDPQWTTLAKVCANMKAYQLEFIDAAGMGVNELRAITMSRGFRVIYVDYLQLLRPENGHLSRYEQVTAISLGLHTLARQCKCAVIALAQLARPDRAGGRQAAPTLSSFRESGQIEQDADAALLLYQADSQDPGGLRVLKVAKNKEGRQGKLDLRFDGAKQTMRVYVPRSQPQTDELEG